MENNGGSNLSPEHFERFALAGNAVFTLVGKSSRFTYKICKAPEKEGYPPTWFVKVLTGPQNESDYQYVGMLRRDVFGGSYRHGSKSKISEDAPSIKAFRWTWERVVCQGQRDLKVLEIWHVGKCGKCGRPLTDPQSIATGLGPVCSGKGA